MVLALLNTRKSRKGSGVLHPLDKLDTFPEQHTDKLIHLLDLHHTVVFDLEVHLLSPHPPRLLQVAYRLCLCLDLVWLDDVVIVRVVLALVKSALVVEDVLALIYGFEHRQTRRNVGLDL
jgi:hypothetical protein